MGDYLFVPVRETDKKGGVPLVQLSPLVPALSKGAGISQGDKPSLLREA